MFKIDNNSAALTQPALSAAGSLGFYTAGNIALGIAPTTIAPDELNILQNEVSHVVTASGLVLNKADQTQLFQAITRMLPVIPTSVLSFNTRTGAVTLTSGDVITALGYAPMQSFNSRGGNVTLTMSDVITALTFTPVKQQVGSETIQLNFDGTRIAVALNATPAFTLIDSNCLFDPIAVSAQIQPDAAGDFDVSVSLTALCGGYLWACGSRNNAAEFSGNATFRLYVNGVSTTGDVTQDSGTVFYSAVVDAGTYVVQLNCSGSLVYSANVTAIFLPFIQIGFAG